MEMLIMDEAKIFDYITTILLTLIPVILVYQDQILAQIPASYKLVVIIIFAALSQYAANRRVATPPETPVDSA